MSAMWRKRKYSPGVNGCREEERPLNETRPAYVFITEPGNVPQDIPESFGVLARDVILSRKVFESAEDELERICLLAGSFDEKERFEAVDASLKVLVRRDPLLEKEAYFPETFKYSADEKLELEKRIVDVFVPSGHGVLFPDGSWMSALASDQFHGHKDYGKCTLCPKTGYNFNPDKFWGMSGHEVPHNQHAFGPPAGSSGETRWTHTDHYEFNKLGTESSRAEYETVRQDMVERESNRARLAQESLESYDRANAQHMVAGGMGH